MASRITRAAAAKELLRRQDAQASLLEFTKYRFPNYASAPHHKLICEKLEAVERGEIKRLMIFMPPRHGKSELASKSFPAWFLGRNPLKQIIACSYNSELAGDFGRSVRNIVNSQEYSNIFNDVTLSPDNKAADRWQTNRGGVYVSAGVGSSMTGRGADILLIDDPTKDRAEADSPTVRQRVWDWWTSTAYTRLMPGGAIIIIQTRWHMDDLSGRLLKEAEKGGEQWDVLSLPAIDKDNEALWPEWFPLGALKKIKTVIGSRDWSALYQQDPAGDDKSGFDNRWLRMWRPSNLNNLNKYIIVDPAGEKKKTSDYTVFIVFGLGEDQNYYICDWVRDRLNLTERANVLFNLHKQYRPLAVGYEKYGLQSDIEHFQDAMQRQNYRFQITTLAGSTAKNDRIKKLIPLFEAGRVYLPETCVKRDYEGNQINITQSFIKDEYELFPVAPHDDMLDCMARMVDPDLHTRFPLGRSQAPRQTMADDNYKPLDMYPGHNRRQQIAIG